MSHPMDFRDKGVHLKLQTGYPLMEVQIDGGPSSGNANFMLGPATRQNLERALALLVDAFDALGYTVSISNVRPGVISSEYCERTQGTCQTPTVCEGRKARDLRCPYAPFGEKRPKRE